MSGEQQIVVRGVAERPAPADLASLSVVVQVDDAVQEVAFERATDLATAVDAVLDHHAGSLGPRQAAVVVVQPTTRWVDGEEQRTGWRAARSTTLDVSDLTHLSPLLAALVGAGAVVHGPAWRLRPDHAAFDEARGLAAADARQRAEAYAKALGLRVGRVDWVAEPGLRLAPRDPGGPMLGPMAMTAEGAADAEMAVAPAELVVTAAVDVGFAIER